MTRTYVESDSIVRGRKSLERELLHWARNGDWDCLALYVKDHRVCSRELRALISAILQGKQRRRQNRTQTLRSQSHRAVMAMGVHIDQRASGRGREASIDKIADEMGIHRRTVQRALKEHPEPPDVTLQEWETFVEDLKKRAPPVVLNLTRYETDRGALTEHHISPSPISEEAIQRGRDCVLAVMYRRARESRKKRGGGGNPRRGVIAGRRHGTN
jgi:hypothetical protein